MSYKEILVHADNTAGCTKRVETALELATRNDAHLVGLYVVPDPIYPVYDMGQIPAELIEMQEEEAQAGVAKAEKIFQKLTSPHSATTEWRVEQGHPVDVIGRHAKYCDLVVVGQRNPGDPGDLGDVPDQLILSVGRPVLIVPHTAKSTALGKRVMVGWDASANASRAVHDAMPILETADSVSVLAINPRDVSNGHGQIPSADISLHLARHGVKAEAQSIEVDDIGVADMLLSRLADEGCDLFVMGAYGHARLRELVLGGVTKHMLEHMTVPVLMAH